MTSVFLSYARSDDEPFVRRLHDRLTQAGFCVWFDRVSMPARQLAFYQEIRDAIAACDRLVLVVGPAALASDYVTQEWRFAYFEALKCVNPIVRLDGHDAAGQPIDAHTLLPPELALIHAEDFRRDAEFEEHLANLVRQLSEPLPPAGKLVAVPALPAHFVAQPGRIAALRDMLLADLTKPVVVSGAAGRVGLQGMGGIGKSVLASALAHHPEVRRAFPDGVFWVTLGQQPHIEELQHSLLKALGDDGVFSGVEAGKQKLRDLLAGRAALLVLDDAWQRLHAEAFNVVSGRCRLLLTTRDAGLVTALTANENHYQVQLPSMAEAETLLAQVTGLALPLPPEARAVIEQCGRLPLAVALCGGMARRRVPFADILDALHERDLRYISDRHPLEAQHADVWHVIDASVHVLGDDERKRFTELAVFALDTGAPEAAVLTLWAHTASLRARSARELLAEFAERSLIERGGKDGRMRLHDLVHNFATAMAEKLFGCQAALHQRLTNAYKVICPNGWVSGPNDGYYWENLWNHLAQEESWDELSGIACNSGFLERQRELAGLHVVRGTLRFGLATALMRGSPEIAQTIFGQWRLHFGDQKIRQSQLISAVPYIELREMLEAIQYLEMPMLPCRVVLLLAWNALRNGYIDLCSRAIKQFLSQSDAYLVFEEAHLFFAFFRQARQKSIPEITEAWVRAYPTCFAASSILRSMSEFRDDIPKEILNAYRQLQLQIPYILPKLSDTPSEADVEQALNASLKEERNSTRDMDPLVRSLLNLELDSDVETALPAYAANIHALLDKYPGQTLASGATEAYRDLLSDKPLAASLMDHLDFADQSSPHLKLRMAQAVELALASASNKDSHDASISVIREVSSLVSSLGSGSFRIGGRSLPYRRESFEWSTDARILLCLFKCASVVAADFEVWKQIALQSRSLRTSRALQHIHLVLSAWSVNSGMPNDLIRILLDCSMPPFSEGEDEATTLGVTLALRSDRFDGPFWMLDFFPQEDLISQVVKRHCAVEIESIVGAINEHIDAVATPDSLNTPVVLAAIIHGFSREVLPRVLRLPPSVERDVLLYAACLWEEADTALEILPLIRDIGTRLGAARSLIPNGGKAGVRAFTFAEMERAVLPRTDAVLSVSAEASAFAIAARRATTELLTVSNPSTA